MTMTSKNTASSMITLSNSGRMLNVSLATCPQCGKEFFKTHYAQKYCTMECAKEAVASRKPAPVVKEQQVGRAIPAHLYHSNFKNKAERTERMLILRSQGCTNKEIAQKVGLSAKTVRQTIGTQPAAMTANSFKARGAKQRIRTEMAKANKVMFDKSKKYEQACDHAADLQHQIDLLQIRLMTAKGNVMALESGYISATGANVEKMIRCECCGRLVEKPKKGVKKYCPSCANRKAQYNRNTFTAKANNAKKLASANPNMQ